MTRSQIQASLAVLLLFGGLASPAFAAKDIPFETVKGWEVERSAANPGPDGCTMSRAYKDADDGNATNAVVFGLDGGNANLVLVYEKWAWDKKQKVRAPLSLDKSVYAAKATWIGDGTTLASQFPDSIVPNLLAAKTLVLKFDNGTADFKIPNFAEGYESLRRCNLAKPVASAPATSAPSPAPVMPTPAGAYVISTIGEGKDFAGCMALNETAGISLVGVGQSLGLIANAPKFSFGKGATVKGSWSVDQGAAVPFVMTADTAKTVSLDVPSSPAAVIALTTGKVLSIEANGVLVPFSLAGMNQGFDKLAACMETRKAP